MPPRDEASLFANTVMYISQRKQCEICAAQQNGQEDVHFVIRVSSVNAQQVLVRFAEWRYFLVSAEWLLSADG